MLRRLAARALMQEESRRRLKGTGESSARQRVTGGNSAPMTPQLSPEERFIKWMRIDPCVKRAHQLVLGKETEIARRRDQLRALPSRANVRLTPDQLLGRARAEIYCESFEGPLMPGLDYLGDGVCAAPEFCSWILPPPPPPAPPPALVSPSSTSSSASPPLPPPSYILSCHLVATSPTYNPLSNSSHPHTAIDTFLKAGAAQDGLAARTMQVHLVHDSPLVTAPISTYRGVTLHRLAAPIKVGSTLLPAIDARWEAYGQALRAVRPADDACIFMIDFSDVRPLRNPAQLCVDRPDALMVSSDTCRREREQGRGRVRGTRHVRGVFCAVGERARECGTAVKRRSH